MAGPAGPGTRLMGTRSIAALSDRSIGVCLDPLARSWPRNCSPLRALEIWVLRARAPPAPAAAAVEAWVMAMAACGVLAALVLAARSSCWQISFASSGGSPLDRIPHPRHEASEVGAASP
jgi:hypothetical protein